MPVQLGPGVRIIPPSDVIGNRWVADDLGGKRRFTVNREVAAALVAATRPIAAADLAAQLSETTGCPASWHSAIEHLVARGLFVDADESARDPSHEWLRATVSKWGQAGWREAADYHLLTFDYPCIDYSEASAVGIDRSRMRDYQAEEPDENRYKLNYVDRPGVALPAPFDVGPTPSARSIWTYAKEPEPVTFERIATVLSLTFGVTDERTPVSVSTPLLRRTAPSGGGRNPSEGYLLVRDVPGLEPGWHHITLKPFSVRTVAPADGASTTTLFPDLPANASAVVVLTSMFERNMYRYREPRTFRTVHMDAGHLIGTARLVAESLGLRAIAGDGGDARAIEATLGLDGMAEGFIGALALCGDEPEFDAPPAARPETVDPTTVSAAGWPAGVRIRSSVRGDVEVADTITGAVTTFDPAELARTILASHEPPTAVAKSSAADAAYRASVTPGLRHWQHRHWHPSDQVYTASRRTPRTTACVDAPPRPITGAPVALSASAAPGAQPIGTLLLNRRTGRAYIRRAVPGETLSGLLRHGFGKRLTIRSAEHWIPSLWAIGVCVYNVEGVPAGSYRYDPHAHLLHAVQPGDHREEMIHVLQGMRSPSSAGWTIGLIADFERAQQAMPHEAGLRSIYTQSGVIAQELIVLAGSYGLSTLVTPAQIDSAYLALHGLTRDSYGPIYTLTMGLSHGAAGIYPDDPVPS